MVIYDLRAKHSIWQFRQLIIYCTLNEDWVRLKGQTTWIYEMHSWIAPDSVPVTWNCQGYDELGNDNCCRGFDQGMWGLLQRAVARDSGCRGGRNVRWARVRGRQDVSFERATWLNRDRSSDGCLIYIHLIYLRDDLFILWWPRLSNSVACVGYCAW